jgi:protein TonB
MSGGPIHRIDAVIPRDGGDLSHVAPLALERSGTATSAPPISATNVVPFVRPRRDAAAPGSAAGIAFDPAARPAPPLIAGDGRARLAALLALSLAVHSGLYGLFTREPEPMASIGVEAISVEFVLGADRPAGTASTPGQREAQSAPADDVKPIDPDTTNKVEETKPAEATPAQAPQRLAQIAVAAISPEQPRPQTSEPAPDRPAQQVAILRAEETPVPREAELIASPLEPAKPEPVTAETRPEPKAAPKQEPKKTQREARPKDRPGPSQKTASREPNPTGPHASAASDVGAGRSQLDTNYPGLVAAHLARYKRYPPEASSRGEHGTASVSVALDGGGRVTRVSLVRGTGSEILDQEATAMVRRASPFPAPPDGRSKNLTVPISFRQR